MPASTPPLFFRSSQSVDHHIGKMFSFVWANYAGLRELWWQVRGFRAQFPEVHIRTMKTKFFAGLPLPGGVDLKHTFLATEWEDHEREYAKWILFESCTLYESWLEGVCEKVFPESSAGRHAKSLQFPTGKDKKGRENGFMVAVRAANVGRSSLMVDQFFPTLQANKLNVWESVNEHLVAYRYFKECRNAIIHGGGAVTEAVVEQHAELRELLDSPPIPFRHPFSLGAAPRVGDRIELILHDTILAAMVVRGLINTFDAALCVAGSNEVLLEKRVRAETDASRGPKSNKWRNLPNDEVKVRRRLGRLLVAADLPEPVSLAAVATWMHSKKIVWLPMALK